MNREVGEDSIRSLLVTLEENSRQLRIDRTGGTDNIRIQLPRVPTDGAILHQEASIEADRGLLDDCAEGTHGLHLLRSCRDRVSNHPRKFFQITQPQLLSPSRSPA